MKQHALVVELMDLLFLQAKNISKEEGLTRIADRHGIELYLDESKRDLLKQRVETRSEVIRDALAELQVTNDAASEQGKTEKQGVPKFFVAVSRSGDDPFPPVEKLLGVPLAKLDMSADGSGQDCALSLEEQERYNKLDRPPLCVELISPDQKTLSDEIQRVVNEFWAHDYNRAPMHGSV